MAENFFGITDTGRQRDNNEDAFIAQFILNRQFVMACVIDGVGGYEGGEIAAAIARETILQSFKTPPADMIRAMQIAFASANDKIFKEKIKSEQHGNMACVATLAIADTKHNKFYYAHIGDTRLYLYRDHSLIKVTKDQSFVGFLEDSGRLSEEEAMKHPKRNEINKALGFEAQASLSTDSIETGESPFLPGDMILLCSDGLTDMVGSKEIAAVLESKTSVEQKAGELIAAANAAGGKDNITVVLVQNNKRPARQEVRKPVLVKKRTVEKIELAPSQPIEVKEKRVLLPKERNKKGIIALLSVLCFVFFAGMVWLWLQRSETAGHTDATAKHERNVQEIRLQTFINASPGDTVTLNDAGKATSVFLTDTIWVRRDSLYIKGNDLALIKDSSYGKTVALVLAPECKHIVLENMKLQGFDIAILASAANGLHLKNVQFKNCRVAVGYRFEDGATISGLITSNQRSKKDSL